jgi:hypothetical protein
MAHERPPIVFDNNCLRSVEAPVSNIVMPCLYGFDVTVLVEYSLVRALWILLPKNVLVQEEPRCLANQRHIILIREAVALET